MTKTMRVVLDTNVVLRAISSKSKLSIILDELFNQSFTLLVSSEILLEYEELITKFYGISIAKDFLDFLTILPNVEKVEPHFHLGLIEKDPDDNKFSDCAFAGNVHFLVTDDKHFNILKEIEFPRIEVIMANDFLNLFI